MDAEFHKRVLKIQVMRGRRNGKGQARTQTEEVEVCELWRAILLLRRWWWWISGRCSLRRRSLSSVRLRLLSNTSLKIKGAPSWANNQGVWSREITRKSSITRETSNSRKYETKRITEISWRKTREVTKSQVTRSDTSCYPTDSIAPASSTLKTNSSLRPRVLTSCSYSSKCRTQPFKSTSISCLVPLPSQRTKCERSPAHVLTAS